MIVKVDIKNTGNLLYFSLLPFYAICVLPISGGQKMDGIVSTESVALHEQIRTEEEVEERERKRVEAHAQHSIEEASLHQKHSDAENKPHHSSAGRLAFFLVNMKNLPGPVVLQHQDGTPIFSSKGEEDVTHALELESRGFASDVLKLNLKLPAMGFSNDFTYHAKEGRFIFLEGTDEGLKNTQRTDPE